MLGAAILLTASIASAFALPAALEGALGRGAFPFTPKTFHIIALSHIADGCASRVTEGPAEARACIERALARAQRTKSPRTSLDDGRAGLWLTHLALILGAAHETGPCLDEALHRRVVTGLVNASLADPTGHTSTYAGTKERWPADQSATLAAIARFDRGHGTSLHTEPLRRYRAALEGKENAETKLPWSELSGAGTGMHPRGCGIAYAVRYLSEVDVALARAWWTSFRGAYLVDRFLVVGFREWPPGVDGKEDADSGPIVQGIGSSATAFSIAAARAMDDGDLANRLERTVDVVEGMASLSEQTRTAAASTLAQAIRFQASAQRTIAKAVANAPAASDTKPAQE